MNTATNTAEQLPEEHQAQAKEHVQGMLHEVSMLSLVQKPESLAHESIVVQALLSIREMLSSKHRNPAYIFDHVLNEGHRESLCFAAGLKRSDLSKTFNELDEDARVNIKKAVLMFGDIFSAFNERKALETKKFLKVEV